MMPVVRTLSFFLLLVLGSTPASALEWQATTLDVRAEPFQKVLTLVFRFRNEGPAPVNLLDLQTSCTCLAARSDKKVYAPGENGQITAQFSAEEPPGIYERQIHVVTDPAVPPQHLTVRVEIPELAILTPRSLEWKISEDMVEKSVELRANGVLRITFTRATPSNETFTARLETVIPDEVYKLVVVPRSTATVANAAIRIYGRDQSGHEILISAYANVR